MRVVVLEHSRLPSTVHFNDIANTPLWSCVMAGYATACLEGSGHDVIFLDAPARGWDFTRAQEAVLAAQPELICINGVYFWEHTGHLFDFMTELKTRAPDVHLNLFGFFPSLIYETLLCQVPAVDSIAVGECEWTLVELAERLQTGSNWQSIAGLAIRSAGNPVLKESRAPEVDPDRFPFPRRDSDELWARDTRQTRAPDYLTASVLASRGCYNHCSFCPIPSFYNQGPLWHGRSPDNIFREVAELVDRGFTEIYFVDPNFFGPGRRGRLRVLELAERLETLGISFGLETRPDDLDEDILKRLRSAGLQTLLLGIEGGSTAILGNLNKSSSVNAGERAVQSCRMAGIEPEIGFLMFTPDAAWSDLRRNYSFLKNLDLLDRLDRTANLLGHRQIVLRGTSSYRWFEREGRLTPDGPLGMEGLVAYRDPIVEWMAEVFVPICRMVHREMARSSSPIYWRHDPGSRCFMQINDYLVNTFAHLLAVAAVEARHRSADAMRQSSASMRSHLEGDICDILTST